MADVAYESVSGDALLVWADNTDLKFSAWNGTSWTAAALLSDYATLSGGTVATHVSLGAKPGGNEMVLAVTDNLGKDYAFVWNGSSWSAGQQFSAAGGNAASDVVYEAQSGRAMLVYGDAGASGYYRIWNGTSWSAQSSFAAPAGPFGLDYVNLAADPASNRIAVAMTPPGTAGSVPYWLNVWDGSSWGTSLQATGSGVDQLMPGIDVAFESTSGDAVAAYGISGVNTIAYRTWTAAGGWSAEQTAPVAFTAAPRVVTLAADPYSDRVMLAEQDGNSDLYTAQWNGSAWGSAALLDANTGATNSQPFEFVWYRVSSNRAPVAVNDSVSGNEGATSAFMAPWVLSNDSDPDGDTLTASLVSGPSHAVSFTLNSDGGFSYRHDGSETASDSFVYRASDGHGAFADATVTITVNPVNNAPVNSVPGGQTTSEDIDLIFSAGNGNLISISDADAGSNAVQVTLTGTNGVLTLSGTTGLAFSSGDGTADGA